MPTQEMQTERLSLPLAVTEYPIDIGILGFPISKTEYAERQHGIVDFITFHMSEIRDVLDRVASLTVIDIDARITAAHSALTTDAQRAKMSWEILAWNVLIRPFEHPSRSYHFAPEKYEKFVEKDADALYLYAVFVVKTPSARVHEILKTLHPETARMYYNYARNYTIASDSFTPIDLITNW